MNVSLYPYAERFPVVRSFPQVGRPRVEVLSEIDVMSEVEDSPYHEGRISGSIYSGDDELLVKKGTNRFSEHWDLLRGEGYSLRLLAATCHDAAF